MNKSNMLLLFIFLIGTFFRFYRLDTLPPSLEWDEVATGYDANSILRTGKDQYGKQFPITLRSLDDYKPPVYTYLTSLSIAVWGWNDFAIRFPAAFLGSLALLTTYALVLKLFKDQTIALISTAALAFSPWHINFSRLALETNSTIFVTTLAVFLFLKGLDQGKYLLFAALLFGIDLYLYHNARVFIPLLVFLLICLYFKQLLKHKLAVTMSAIILSIFLIRLIPIVTSVEGTMRFAGTSIFTNAQSLDVYAERQQYQQWRQDDTLSHFSFLGKLFHNDKVYYGLRILNNYLVHFNPSFWLFTDDQPRHHVSELGILYLVDLPFVYIGLAVIFLQKIYRKEALIVVSWWLFAPIAASVTRDVPHSLRAELMLPIFQIFIAFGFLHVYKLITKNQSLKFLYIFSVAILYFFNIAFFLHQYFVHFAKDTSQDWQYGRKEAALFADSIKNQYDRILVSTRLEQSHMFFLYYLKYDPQKYLAEGGTFSGGWEENRNHFDKYFFQSIDYSNMKDGKTLFIGLPNEFPKTTSPLRKIYYLNGKEAIWIVSG